jgi:hypothetical protein
VNVYGTAVSGVNATYLSGLSSVIQLTGVFASMNLTADKTKNITIQISGVTNPIGYGLTSSFSITTMDASYYPIDSISSNLFLNVSYPGSITSNLITASNTLVDTATYLVFEVTSPF